jgi:hypothetical protein
MAFYDFNNIVKYQSYTFSEKHILDVFYILKRNIVALLTGTLIIRIEKRKYILLCHPQNAGQNHDIEIAKRCFENVAQFRYLRKTTNQNLIQEEIKRRLNLGNACYHSVQNLLSFRLMYKNINVRIYKTIILPVVLYGVKLCL